MALNESQQQELARVLSSDLFLAAEQQVLRMTDGKVEDMPLEEAAIKMALEKGARNAFRLLRKITEPGHAPITPLTRKSITRTS